MLAITPHWRPKKKEKLREDKRVDWQKSRAYTVKRDVKVLLKDDKKLSAKTFEDAARHPEIAASRIAEIEMVLSNSETSSSLSVGGRWTKNLRLSVTGANQQDRERLFIALRNWVIDCQAPTWQRAWSWAASHWIQWFTWWVVIAGLSSQLLPGKQYSPYIDEAHQLLTKGIGDKDLPKALEIILALESGYGVRSSPSGNALLFFLVAIGGLLVCIAVSIYPRVEVGLGKGRIRIRIWTWWMRFVVVSVPLFVFSTVARNALSEIFKRII